jgi:hypothetical protein
MYKLDRESQVPPPSLEHKFACYMWYIYVCPKRTYSCMKRMRGQQVYLRERIPNAMFVSLSTYFYIGTRMLNYSRKDVVYTNADERGFVASNPALLGGSWDSKVLVLLFFKNRSIISAFIRPFICGLK